MRISLLAAMVFISIQSCTTTTHMRDAKGYGPEFRGGQQSITEQPRPETGSRNDELAIKYEQAQEQARKDQLRNQQRKAAAEILTVAGPVILACLHPTGSYNSTDLLEMSPLSDGISMKGQINWQGGFTGRQYYSTIQLAVDSAMNARMELISENSAIRGGKTCGLGGRWVPLSEYGSYAERSGAMLLLGVGAAVAAGKAIGEYISSPSSSSSTSSSSSGSSSSSSSKSGGYCNYTITKQPYDSGKFYGLGKGGIVEAQIKCQGGKNDGDLINLHQNRDNGKWAAEMFFTHFNDFSNTAMKACHCTD